MMWFLSTPSLSVWSGLFMGSAPDPSNLDRPVALMNIFLSL